jgi:hypothetical protein
MKFKVGDKVNVKRKCSGAYPEKTYILRMEKNTGTLHAYDTEERETTCSCPDNWILIKPKNEFKIYN